MAPSPGSRRAWVAAGCVVVLLLAACAGGAADPRPAADPCRLRNDVNPCSLEAGGSLYCTVLATRDLFASGAVPASRVPPWMDLRRRAGVPVVLDLEDVRFDDLARVEALLRAWFVEVIGRDRAEAALGGLPRCAAAMTRARYDAAERVPVDLPTGR